MARLLLLVVFVLGAAFSRGLPSLGTSDLRIYGGHTISIEEAPFTAALFIKINNSKSFFCGGSIINDRFIVTAAHCMRNTTSSSLVSIKVIVGSDNLYDPERILIETNEKLCHETYDPRVRSNDICLIKLKEPLKFGSKVAAVTLPEENFNLNDGTLVNITGWGYMENSTEVQSSLRQVTVPVKNECPAPVNRKTVICTRIEGHSSCFGDSGGPLTTNRVLVGVISGGLTEKCGKMGSYHTRVTSYLQWIKTTMSKMNE